MTLLSAYHLDALKELVNTGVGKAAAALNEMLESHIVLQVPSIAQLTLRDLEEGLEGLGDTKLSCVQLAFQGSFAGIAALVFPPQSAAKLVSALTGEDPETPSLDAVMAGTLNEVGNIVINGVMGTVGNVLAQPFNFSLPNYLEGRLSDLLKANEHAESPTILLIRAHFRVSDRQIEGNIFLIFEFGSFDNLLAAIDDFYQAM